MLITFTLTVLDIPWMLSSLQNEPHKSNSIHYDLVIVPSMNKAIFYYHEDHKGHPEAEAGHGQIQLPAFGFIHDNYIHLWQHRRAEVLIFGMK